MATPAPAAIKIKRHSTKAKDGGARGPQGPAARLKVVIRHLPSSLKESEFREAMKDVINDNTTEYFSWIGGKVPADRNKAPVPSRCYVKLRSPEDLNALSNALRNYGTFTDSKGVTSAPHMEFAPFQKVPKKSQRPDARTGTIENDVEFQAFLAALMVAPVKQDESAPTIDEKVEGEDKPAAPSSTPQIDLNAPAPIPVNDPLSVPLPTNEAYEKPKTTPLIEAIRSQKQAVAEKSAKSKGDRGAASATPSSASSESGSSRSSKRAERRARERAAKGQEKKEAPAPTALLKRVDSGIAPPRILKQTSAVGAGSSSQAGGKAGEKATEKEKGEKEKDDEKEKPKARDRRPRGAGAGVAAILQRDLGLGGPAARRTRGKQQPTAASSSTEPEKKTETASSESTKPATDTPSTPTKPSANTPATDTSSTASARSPAKPRERPSRRERRAARIEREESSASTTPAPTPSAPPVLLKKQASSTSAASAAPATPALLKRDTSVVPDSVPSTSTTAPTKPSPTKSTPPSTPVPAAQSPAQAPPTGPRGGSVVRGRGGRGGIRGGINLPVGQPAPAQGPPTGPSAEVARGRGRGRGPIFRGPRGRGGPAMRGGAAQRGGGSAGAPTAPAPAASSAAPSGPAA